MQPLPSRSLSRMMNAARFPASGSASPPQHHNRGRNTRERAGGTHPRPACWTASSISGAPRLAGPEGLPRDPSASDHAAAPAGQGEHHFADGLCDLPDNRRLAILAVCAVEWETFLAAAVGGDPRPDRRQNVSRSRARLRSAARERDGRGPRGAPGVRRTGWRADRRAGHRRGARHGDRGRSRMGGSRCGSARHGFKGAPRQ